MNIDCLKLKKPCYLRFDKNQMTNLQISMNKEMLLTNHLGGFCSTTIVGCNIRKYNGLVVVPIASMDNEKHVLLSSLDETVIQHVGGDNYCYNKGSIWASISFRVIITVQRAINTL